MPTKEENKIDGSYNKHPHALYFVFFLSFWSKRWGNGLYLREVTLFLTWKESFCTISVQKSKLYQKRLEVLSVL